MEPRRAAGGVAAGAGLGAVGGSVVARTGRSPTGGAPSASPSPCTARRARPPRSSACWTRSARSTTTRSRAAFNCKHRDPQLRLAPRRDPRARSRRRSIGSKRASVVCAIVATRPGCRSATIQVAGGLAAKTVVKQGARAAPRGGPIFMNLILTDAGRNAIADGREPGHERGARRRDGDRGRQGPGGRRRQRPGGPAKRAAARGGRRHDGRSTTASRLQGHVSRTRTRPGMWWRRACSRRSGREPEVPLRLLQRRPSTCRRHRPASRPTRTWSSPPSCRSWRRRRP